MSKMIAKKVAQKLRSKKLSQHDPTPNFPIDPSAQQTIGPDPESAQREIQNISGQLKSMGFGVGSPQFGMGDNNRHFVSVYPSAKWMKAVDAGNEAYLNSVWEGRHGEKADEFEDFMVSNGYELNGSGGGNFDYWKDIGGQTVGFLFWGNPWHI